MHAMVILAALIGLWDDGQLPPRDAKSPREVRVCGTVETRRTDVPSRCDAVLVVRQGTEAFDVVVPASVRPHLPRAPELLVGGEACFTGFVNANVEPARLSIGAASDVSVTTAPPRSAFDTAATICDAGVQVPNVVRDAKPKYTEAAMRARVQGTVEVEALVAADGTVSDVRMLRPLHPDLDNSALDAVKQWTFKPGMKRGNVHPVAVTIEMTFTLK